MLKTFYRKISFVVLFALLLSILIRLLFIFYLQTDSDEITYSIIGRRVLALQDFHIFALNQKYMGAIEGYIIGIFQAIFGYNLVTLRINSLLFSTGTLLIIIFILKKISKIESRLSRMAGEYGILATIIFTLASHDVAVNFTKAWGNRPLVAFLGVFIIYAAWLLFFRKHNLTRSKEDILAVITGFLLGVGFFANLEAVYFIIISFTICLLSLVDIRLMKLPSIPKLGNQLLTNFLYKIKKNYIHVILNVLFYFFLFWIYYLIFTRKSLFNPYETLTSKFGIHNNSLKFLDFSLENVFFLALFYMIASVKLVLFPSKNNKLRNFSLLYSLFTVSAYFAISRNSVERTNQVMNTLQEQWEYLYYMLNVFFGFDSISKSSLIYKFLLFVSLFTFPIIAVFDTIKYNLASVLKSKKLDVRLQDSFSLIVLIPLMFLFSRAGGMLSTSRYLTNMWPGFVILYSYGAHIFIERFKFRGIFITLFLTCFYIYNAIANTYKPAILSVLKQDYKSATYVKISDYLLSENIKSCYAGFWNGYSVMFASKYKIICSPSDHYRYGRNDTQFNTEIVDKDPNPAFIFGAKTRVDYFKNGFVDKEVKIVKEKYIDGYYIFTTERL